MISNENKAFQKPEIKHENKSNEYFRNLLNPTNPMNEIKQPIIYRPVENQEISINNDKLISYINNLNNQEVITLGPKTNSYENNDTKIKEKIMLDDKSITRSFKEGNNNIINSSFNEELGIIQN